MRMELTAIGWVAAALVVALLISFIATPVVKSIAQMVGAMDVPKDNRRMHKHPIPRMGGLAIFLGFHAQHPDLRAHEHPPAGHAAGRGDHRDPGHVRRHLRPARPAQICWCRSRRPWWRSSTATSSRSLSNPNLFSDNPYWVLGSLSIPLSVHLDRGHHQRRQPH